jgi:stage IV sporulation protein B
MNLRKMKKKVSFLFLLLLLPFNVLAHSGYLIPGGENIGIELRSKGVLIVGTYKVEGTSPSEEAGLKLGDIITKVDGNNVSNVSEMATRIDASVLNEQVKITYLRNNAEKETNLKLYKNVDVYKTGLYVKDSVMGVGTLTFIDPETKKFGALGHEIIEKNTGTILEIKNGKIFTTDVTGIEASSDGNPGEKNARFNQSEVTGEVKKNTTEGLFGIYTDILPDKKQYKVADKKDIKEGEATIFTVLKGNEIKEYKINITKIIDLNKENKNFMFEITDKELLDKTGGIIQGMSGSPIIQGDYIIGAVTHVVVDNPAKGYGIFIKSMLIEAEK